MATTKRLLCYTFTVCLSRPPCKHCVHNRAPLPYAGRGYSYTAYVCVRESTQPPAPAPARPLGDNQQQVSLPHMQADDAEGNGLRPKRRKQQHAEIQGSGAAERLPLVHASQASVLGCDDVDDRAQHGHAPSREMGVCSSSSSRHAEAAAVRDSGSLCDICCRHMVPPQLLQAHATQCSGLAEQHVHSCADCGVVWAHAECALAQHEATQSSPPQIVQLGAGTSSQSALRGVHHTLAHRLWQYGHTPGSGSLSWPCTQEEVQQRQWLAATHARLQAQYGGWCCQRCVHHHSMYEHLVPAALRCVLCEGALPSLCIEAEDVQLVLSHMCCSQCAGQAAKDVQQAVLQEQQASGQRAAAAAALEQGGDENSEAADRPLASLRGHVWGAQGPGTDADGSPEMLAVSALLDGRVESVLQTRARDIKDLQVVSQGRGWPREFFT